LNKLSIPHGALVFVGDGQKALFLRNSGDERFLDLTVQRAFSERTPPTHEQGTDRPGRAFNRANTNRRSSMEATDWHELEKEQFAARMASAIEQLVRAEDINTIVVVAPPRTLAELRRAFHANVRSRIVAEVAQDLTKHPVSEIQKHLTNAHL
jgi:protein required for attachment to host cells